MLITRLIADPDGLETRLKGAVAALHDAGMKDVSGLGSRKTGTGDTVLQMIVGDGERAELRAIVEEHFAPSAALISDGEITVPKLFVSDMDSTMIEQECIDELADFAGVKDKVSAITERAMQGELDFTEALNERVGLLKDLPEATIAECLREKITPMPGARTLVQTLRANGCQTVLVTGGFHHFADSIGEILGFDRVVGNRFAVAGGKLTGGLEGPIADSATKLAVLEEERAKIGEGSVLAMGDGANDIPMLEAATYGVAYKAKPKARAAASGWIDSGNLTAMLSLLGIRDYDWVVD